jgi:hypothetical protein
MNLPAPLIIEIDAGVRKELEYLVELHRRYGAPMPMTSVEALACYVLASIADGSRRPGAWERQMLESLGLVADCLEHHLYRPHGGPPQAG